jgi:heme exporter protein C
MKAIKILYKSLAVVLLFYAVVAGFLMPVPDLPLIGETIRNLYFHVGMWFSMIVMFTISVVFSVIHMKRLDPRSDLIAREAVNVALLFGVLGILTGMVWAHFTWGSWWVNDVKLNGAAIAMLAYLAYKVLRSSVKDASLRARVASVYNVLAFVIMLLFVMILPRTVGESIHPGQDGNPALNPKELDPAMRVVFYPAVLAWILLSIWIFEIRVRLSKLIQKIKEGDPDE